MVSFTLETDEIMSNWLTSASHKYIFSIFPLMKMFKKYLLKTLNLNSCVKIGDSTSHLTSNYSCQLSFNSVIEICIAKETKEGKPCDS